MQTIRELSNFFTRVLKIEKVTETSDGLKAHTSELSDSQLFAIGQMKLQENWRVQIKRSGVGLVIICKEHSEGR